MEKKILRNREVLNRLEINGENNSFITLKDHKENFNNNPTVRLIKPAKNELWHISKAILGTTNKNIREAMGFWINRETQIQRLTGLRVLAINTCASSSYLTLKNFILPLLKTCLKSLNFCRGTHTHIFQTMLGLREAVGYSMSPWKRTMERRFRSYLGIIYFTSYQNYMRKRT